MKACTKCKVEKPFTEFSKDSRSKSRLQCKCKSCAAAYQAQNREKLSAKQSQYYSANRDKKARYNAAYNAANRKSIAVSNAAWAAANQEKCSAIDRNRRARKRSAEGKHSTADVRNIFTAQRGLCANCKTKLFKSGKKIMHVDHIVPLARGGANDKYNLQCLCPSCNLRKSAKDPINWANENGRLL